MFFRTLKKITCHCYNFFFRIVTLDEVQVGGKGSSLNIKALRAVRVLRPLKLISGIPSKSSSLYYFEKGSFKYIL